MMNNIYIYTQLFSTAGPEQLVGLVEILVFFSSRYTDISITNCNTTSCRLTTIGFTRSELLLKDTPCF